MENVCAICGIVGLMVHMIAVRALPPNAGAKNRVSLLSRITPRKLCCNDGFDGSPVVTLPIL